MAKIYLIYHGNCMDGFGSAFAGWMHFRKKSQTLQTSKPPSEDPSKDPQDTVIYLPARHGEGFKLSEDEIRGAEIYITDFAYSKEVLERIRVVAKSLKVLDHHKTAAEQLQGLEYCEFDMQRCGAMMTWDYFHGLGTAPRLIHYIQDRDLWRFQLPFSKEVNAVVQSYPIQKEENFVEFEKLLLQLEDPQGFQSIVSEGRAILRFQRQFIDMAISRSFRMIQMESYEVPAVNTSIFESEVCHRLLEIYPNAPFVATFYSTAKSNTENYSLRSRGDFDVSQIASRWGGGGHAAAAGFQKKRA
jgi:oligoribonuclease NrnB/cAMP/cGMP phosphodiesterase (DHH superfamily)